jgi:hypothetical protein
MQSYEHNPWLVHLVAKLLAGDQAALGLLGHSPFPADKPPKFIKLDLYRYKMTRLGDKSTGAWWKRTFLKEYLGPLSLDNPQLLTYLRANFGWEPSPRRAQ